MQAELKNKWTTALRSGEYEQGQSYLRSSEDKYCCLGVLCDVSGTGTWRDGGDLHRYSLPSGNQRGVTLDLKMLQIFGLNEEDAAQLMSMNDVQKNSFEEIADWIEKNVASA